MDTTHALSEPPPTDAAEPDRTECHTCGSHVGDLPPISLALYEGARLRRCAHCGCRRLEGPFDPPAGIDATAGLDVLPRLEQGVLQEPRRADSAAHAVEPAMVQATERELRRSVASSWEFVSVEQSAEYLDRIVRQTARILEGVPGASRILIFNDPSVRRLALPSGELLFSLGALRAIEDEAELIFVVAHELAHVGSGGASRRLVALSLAGLSRRGGRPQDQAWLNAATDLIRLGHGAEEEHAADRQGLRAVLAQGYDPESVLHYLNRLRERVASADPRVSELHLAHPLPADRLRRLEKSWGAHVRDAGASRVNRDAFRKAVGRSIPQAALVPIRPFPDEDGGGATDRPVPWKDWRVIGTGVAILLLAAIFLLVGLILGR